MGGWIVQGIGGARKLERKGSDVYRERWMDINGVGLYITIEDEGITT